MTKSKKRRRTKRGRFEAASALVLGRARGRRPSKTRRSSFSVRNWLLSSLVVVAAAALWLTLDDRFYVYHADVVGAVRISPDEVFQASGLPGLHVLWVRSTKIEARLLDTLPTVESARVVCRLQPPALRAWLPAKCTIAVVERQPKVAWDEEGRLWWIDAGGVIFSASSSSFPSNEGEAGGLTVRGPLPRGEDDRLDERVRVALTELWAAGVDVSPLLYVPGRGLVFTDERGWRAIVGQGPGMDRRLQVLKRLTADLEARGLTPRFVDVRFADAPYYSLTNDW